MTLHAIEKYLAAYAMPAGYPWVRQMIEEIEAEVGERYVEVVRCGDCAYFDKYPNDEISVCYRFDNEQPIVEPDGFCAWGERKEGGEDD